MESFEGSLSNLKKLYEESQTNISALQNENDVLKDQLSQLNDYRVQVLSLTKDKEHLQRQVRDLEDYSTQFSRVSHVVAMEKENARLQTHIRLLERRIEIYQQRLKEVTQQNPDPVTFESTSSDTPPIVEPKLEQTAPSTVEMKEKKIKGIMYYISKSFEIYAKNEDGTIGDCIGKLEQLSSGKTKVKWTLK